MNNFLPIEQDQKQRKTFDQWVKDHPQTAVYGLMAILFLALLLIVYFAGYSAGIKDAAMLALQGAK